MVRRASLSRFSTYTNLDFSTAATMQARPLGSTAMNSPGTMRLPGAQQGRAAGAG